MKCTLPWHWQAPSCVSLAPGTLLIPSSSKKRRELPYTTSSGSMRRPFVGCSRRTWICLECRNHGLPNAVRNFKVIQSYSRATAQSVLIGRARFSVSFLQRLFDQCAAVESGARPSKEELLQACLSSHHQEAMSLGPTGLVGAFRAFVEGDKGYDAMQVTNWDSDSARLSDVLEKIAVSHFTCNDRPQFAFNSEADLVNSAVCRLVRLDEDGERSHAWEIAEPWALEAIQKAFSSSVWMSFCKSFGNVIEQLPQSAAVLAPVECVCSGIYFRVPLVLSSTFTHRALLSSAW
jgi:hypothetical protein